ncbi:MAG: Fis family transcriptional regulator, partial [Phycisphaerales bacterium]|nr:Fis family transcriptional regulator [Phycisphaerales bacterium]
MIRLVDMIRRKEVAKPTAVPTVSPAKAASRPSSKGGGRQRAAGRAADDRPDAGPAAGKRTVVIGLLGPLLDSGHGAKRWELWRPTVSLFQHDDLAVDRLDLLCEQKFCSLRDVVAADVAAVSPSTAVRHHALAFADPWDFVDVFAALHDFASGFPFVPDAEQYFVHIT